MEPEIVEKGEMLIAGSLYEGKNEHQEIGVMWGEFVPQLGEIQRVDKMHTYGVCEMDEGLTGGAFRYVAGAEIAGPDGAPAGFYQIRVPAGRYAAFKHTGPVEGLSSTFDAIYKDWLPGSGYERADRPDLEVYTVNTDDPSSDFEVQVLVPIK